MSSFYQEVITQKSWRILQEIKKKFDFVLIGGWAVWLYARTVKSKDIDIIIDYGTLGQLKKKFEVVKNERLKKYEVRFEEIEIDIYLPFYSNLGLPAEFVQQEVILKEGFKVPRPEILLILKHYVFEQRKVSIKGQKDKLDILSLLNSVDLDFGLYKEILVEFGQEKLIKKLVGLLKETVRAGELDLKDHQMARLRKRVLPKLPLEF